MQLRNQFFVPASPEETWNALVDVERVAGCMPGASLERAGDDEVTGVMDLKVGPVSLTYEGDARFLEKDEDARRIVLRADGKEQRGAGAAGATVTAQAQGDDGGTRVTVETDLEVTGRPAQFGRGVLADVSQQMLDRFAEALSNELGAQTRDARSADGRVQAETPAAPERGAAVPADERVRASTDQLDVLSVLAGPLSKRALPVLVAGMGLAVGWIAGRRRGAGRRQVMSEFGYRRYAP